jgi:hypothetical protein
MKWQLLFLVAGLTIAGTAVWSHRSQALLVERLVINEVDYDQPGAPDAEEFIEITNTGDTAANLAQYQLQLVNGDGEVYETIPLDAGSLAPGGYYILCRNQALVLNCNQEYAGPIQNDAPNAVALLNGALLVDTVSYEGNTDPPYTEGSGVGLVDDGTAVMQGIARWPDGEDTNQNNVDFSPRCVTPGLANLATNSGCESLFDPAIAVALTAVPHSVPEPGNTVTLTIRVDNNGLLPVSLESLTDNTAQNLNGQGSCQTGQNIAAGGYYSCHHAVMITGIEGDEVMRAATAVVTDQFSNSATDTGQTTITITERIRWDIFLPMVVRPLPYGEPNNSCHEAFALPLNQTRYFLAEDDNDWYVFELAQSGNLQIYWQNFVPQEGQMVLYQGQCDGLAFVANNGETAVNRVLDVGNRPAGRYYLWLINDAQPNTLDEYALRVQFINP